MDYFVDYEDARGQHPAVVEAVTQKLRKSRSKFNKSDVSEMKWQYGVAQMIKSSNLGDMIASAHSEAVEPIDLPTFEEYWEQIKDDFIVMLEVCAGGTSCYREKLNEVPQCVKDNEQKLYDKHHVEQKRLASLTPEERGAEINEILSELSGQPGFAMFGISIPQEEDHE